MYERLNEKLEWKHGRTFVPKGNKRLICLVDDLNLSHVSVLRCSARHLLNYHFIPTISITILDDRTHEQQVDHDHRFPQTLTLISSYKLQVDEHGYQSAVEIIRQHLDEGGFYSAENLQWRYVRNVTYVSTVNPKPNVGVPQLSARLLRHFALFNCNTPR